MTRAITALKAFAALLPALLLASCSPLVVVNALVPDDSYRGETDIAYGPEERHKLDLYQPANGQVSKGLIFFVYGGSWKTGTRTNYRFVGEAFASRGYTVVVPDYRLYPEVRFPAFVEDAALALAWTRRNLEPGVAERTLLMGHSAGAHIAALLALDRRYLDAVDVAPEAVSGWVGLAGPYSFDLLKYRSIRPIFEGSGPPEQTRPITFAHGGAPPALLIHGTDDGTVRPENSQMLAARLTELGAEARYLPLVDVGHSGILVSLSEPFESRAPVIETTLAFFDKLEPRAKAE